MTDDLLPLDMGRTPKRKTGAARAAVEEAMKAWRAAGHLLGQDDAARRRVLRDSADAVDAASATMHGRARCKVCGSADNDGYAGSPGALAYANNIHAALLASVQPTGDDVSDPYTEDTADDSLTDAIAAALTAGPDHAAPADPTSGDQL